MAEDANIRIPAAARDRLAEVAAGEGMSLRAYLAALAQRVTTPAERSARAARAREQLRTWSGYAADAAATEALDAELDRRIDQARQ